jgi:hypothetical protein
MTKNDFKDLLVEIDTVPDLLYYLKDRYEFLKSIYSFCPRIFINLNLQTERDLIALYKRKSNSFNKYTCKDLLEENIWSNYKEEFEDKIKVRDKENEETVIMDNFIDTLLQNPLRDEEMPLHAWELGLLSRRERVTFANKINDALNITQTESRQFAYFNPNTGCWLVFYFQYGGEEDLLKGLQEMTNLKLIKEMKENSFEYSIFGYGFYVSLAKREMALVIEDAENIGKISETRYNESLKYFGKPQEYKINEFT